MVVRVLCCVRFTLFILVAEVMIYLSSRFPFLPLSLQQFSRSTHFILQSEYADMEGLVVRVNDRMVEVKLYGSSPAFFRMILMVIALVHTGLKDKHYQYQHQRCAFPLSLQKVTLSLFRTIFPLERHLLKPRLFE